MGKDLIQQEVVERKIYLIRGQRVMLSTDLAELYEVETRSLVQAVKRNIDRFPDDFMFQLTPKEVSILQRPLLTAKGLSVPDSRSQTVILKRGQNIKYAPYAFTEQLMGR